MKPNRIVFLTPPRISPAHVDQRITCIRAHRERIFQTSTQMLENKLICHNYGHGGAGWTFLFGCVNESIRQCEDQLLQNPHLQGKPIAVIGAGCYGLLTAALLKVKGYQVRIVAKETDNLTSDTAAGFFFPRTRKRATPEEQAIFEARGLESYEAYLEIITGKHPLIKKGPKLLPGYFDPDISPGLDRHIAHGLVSQPELVTIDFGNGKTYQTLEYHLVYINPSELMKELRRAVRELAIPIHQAEIAMFQDLAEPIIFNCAGMGAGNLAHDTRIVPVLGHLIALKDQPDSQRLQYMINAKVSSISQKGFPRDEFIYYAPKESGILGVTFLRGSKALLNNDHEFDRLLQRAHDYFG